MSNGMTYGITLRGDGKQLVGEVKGVQSAFDSLSAATQRNQSQAQQLGGAQAGVTAQMQKTSVAARDLGAAQNNAGQEAHRLAGAQQNVAIEAAKAGAAIMLAKSAISQSVEASSAYSAALTGLASVARYAGEDIGKTLGAATQLTADGLLSTSEAALALKNLLSRGFSTDQAVSMIDRLKDSAAFGKQASLQFGEAVVSATEGLKNENSILVDNAGVTKNVSVMWKEYAAQIGVSVDKLSVAEKRQAEYNGLMRETEAQVGNAALMTDSLAGSQARLAKSTTDAQIAFGQAMTPAMTEATNGLVYMIDHAVKPAIFLIQNLGITAAHAASVAGLAFQYIGSPGNWGNGELFDGKLKRLNDLAEVERMRIAEAMNSPIAPNIGKDTGARKPSDALAEAERQRQAADESRRKSAESEAKRYESLMQSSRDRIAAMQAEIDGTDKLSQSEKELAVFEKQMQDGKTGLIGKHIEAMHAKLQEEAAASRNRDAMLAEQKAREDEIKKLDAENKSLAEKIAAAELETASIGKTKAEIDLLQAARYDHETQIKRETLAKRESANASAADIESLRESIKLREKWKTVQTDQSAARARQDQIDQERKAQVEMWKSVEGAAHDTWTRVWTEGRDAFTNIGKTIKSAILDVLYQMTVKRWIVSVAATSTGSAAGAADMTSALGGNSGGIGSWLSVGKSLWDAGSGALGNFSGFVSDGVMNAGISLYNAGAQSVGSWMIGNADTIGNFADTAGSAFAYASAFKAAIDGQWGRALGTAIGTYFGGPIGGTIGSFVGGLLDGGGKHVSGATTLSGQFNAQGFGGQYLTPWYQDGGLFRASGGGVYTNPVSADQTAAFSAAVGVTKSILDGLTNSAGESARSLDGWTYSFNQAVNDQAQATAVITDMANSMAAHLIPELSQFQRQGEALADTAVRLSAEFSITDSVLSLVGGTFGAVGLASASARDNLVALMGGIQQMSGTMQSYYSNFFTDAERHARDMQALDAQFVALGMTMPTSAAGFRALVSAQDLSTESGRRTFASLMSINGAFAALVPNAEAAARATQDAIKALQDRAAADTSAYRKAADDIRAFAASVRDLQRSLWAGTQAPGGITAAGTRADFIATNAAAAAGDTAAQGRLAGAATAYLDAAKAQAASALDYAREFGFVQAALAETARSVDQAAQSAATLYNLNALIQFTANASGIPEDLRNLIAAQTSQYAVDVRAAMDATTDPALRQVLLDGAGNYTTTVTAALGTTDPAARTLALNASGIYLTTVSAALGQTDEASRRLALTAAGNYMATVTAALGMVDPAARTLALNTANTLITTVSAALGESDPAALRLATDRVSAYAVTVTAALGTDAATSNLRALLSGATDAQMTVNGSLVFDPNSSVATTLNTISGTLDSLLSAALAANTAARNAVVDQGVAQLTADIQARVGAGYDASRLTTTRNADTGAASVSYAGQYATLSGSVSGSGVASSISSTSTAAQTAAQATATHNAALLAEFSSAKAASDRARAAMMTAYTAYPNAGIGGARSESPRAGQYALPDFVRVTAAELAALNSGGTKAAYITAFNAKLAAYDALKSAHVPLPAFAVGTNYVPQDMVAQIHEGEKITSKPYVDLERAERAEHTRLIAKLVDGMELLRRENKVLLEAVAANTLDAANMGKRWNKVGLPPTRAAA